MHPFRSAARTAYNGESIACPVGVGTSAKGSPSPGGPSQLVPKKMRLEMGETFSSGAECWLPYLDNASGFPEDLSFLKP